MTVPSPQDPWADPWGPDAPPHWAPGLPGHQGPWGAGGTPSGLPPLMDAVMAEPPTGSRRIRNTGIPAGALVVVIALVAAAVVVVPGL